MGTWLTADLIDYYDRRRDALDDKGYRDFWEDEILLLLNARDELYERWAELRAEQEERVLAMDEAVKKKRALIARPGPVPNPNVTDRRRWWWFLHEESPVRAVARD